MIACTRCGQESPQGSLHCVHCGHRLEEDGPAKTVLGMPAIRPLGPPAEKKPAGLLAGLPALRSKTTSPLVSQELNLRGAGDEVPGKTVVGLPLFEGAVKATEGAGVDPEAPTVGMMGLTDDQLAAAEPGPTVAMQGLTDDQLAAAAAAPAQVPAQPAQLAQPASAAEEAPTEPAGGEGVRAVARPGRRDDPAHHPQRHGASARRLGEPKSNAMLWVVIVAVIAGAAVGAWYFLR